MCNIFKGYLEVDYILQNPVNNIIIQNKIITISPNLPNDYSNYTITVGSSNTFGSNSYDFIVTDYKQTGPEYIDDISNIDIFLSDQEFKFDYNDYFTGLMQKFYMISDLNLFNTITLSNTIYTISTQLYDSNYYDLVFGVSNIFGSNEFTLHVTDYKKTGPEYINGNTIYYLDMKIETKSINFSDIFTGFIESYTVVENLYPNSNNLNIDLNAKRITLDWISQNEVYDIEIAFSNVFGYSNITIQVTDYEHKQPEKRIDNIIDYDLLDVFTCNIYDIFSGVIEYYNITKNFGDTATIVDGQLQITGIPDSSNAYDIEVFCSNFSGSNTWTIGIIDLQHIAPTILQDTFNCNINNQEHYNINNIEKRLQ